MSRQAGYPQALCDDSYDVSHRYGTMKAAPEKAATSLQGLTKSTPAIAKQQGASMATPKPKPNLRPDDPRHGSWAGYGAGCRLDCCREAARNYQKRRRYDADNGRPRMVDSRGTKRRLRALAAIGWDFYSIATEMGEHREWVWQIYRRDTVRVITAKKVEAAYDRLCMTVPTGWVADRARRSAVAKGWVGPLAWDDIDNDDAPNNPEADPEQGVDEVKVLRVVNGWAEDCNTAERYAVIERWEGSIAELERVTGWHIHRMMKREAA